MPARLLLRSCRRKLQSRRSSSLKLRKQKPNPMQLDPKRMSDGQSVSVSAAAWLAMQRNRRRRRAAVASGAGSAAEMPGDYVAQFRAAMVPLSVGDPVDVWPDMSG